MQPDPMREQWGGHNSCHRAIVSMQLIQPTMAKRDIWSNWTDVIGSVANYFVRHGWVADDQVVVQASLGETVEWRDTKKTRSSQKKQ